MASIRDNLTTIQQRIETAAAANGRQASEIRLLPVSKTHPMEMLREAAAAGYTQLAENKVQELVSKSAALEPGERIGFSFIGHLQTNKARQVAELADEFQCLDSARVAKELDKRLQPLGKRLPVLVQVNSSGEEQKFGVAPDQAVDLVRELAAFDALDVRGLMTVAVKGHEQQVAACFERMRELQDRLRQAQALGSAWDELSMGMSADLELAIAHGSTCVRVGTAIFGARDCSQA
ncbi:YggS family pyridoxal phosphate-dependent enzyme [Luteococcus peritonei]|uniref:Pyridoxal phosphate homeostasis protein n=1 Tax=Luteococcus peritonei TaxID=88874 RepID=A0ABW4RW00_9ACTN